MSSYLLAFIVSQYRGRFNNDKTFGVYTRPEAIEETALALDFGQKILKKLGEYVGIDYYSIDKIDKLDMAVRKFRKTKKPKSEVTF
jgi:aminopeptidase N